LVGGKKSVDLFRYELKIVNIFTIFI